MFVAVSQSSDPLGQWSVKGLKVKPSAATFTCSASAGSAIEPFFANYPQVCCRAGCDHLPLKNVGMMNKNP